MNLPNTSRQFGEWGIKLRAKLKFVIIGALVIFLAVGCFCGFYYFVDTAFDRSVGDWFEENYLVYINYGFDRWGNSIDAPMLRWTTLKTHAMIVAVTVIVIWIISILFAIYFAQKKTLKTTVSRAGKMIRDYFAPGEQNIQFFPEAYSELFTYASDLKVQILHKEQALKDEAAKKNDLIAYLAHDLKTPLTSVVGYLTLLEEAPEMPPEQKAKYVHIALDKALRLEQLINEFFEITRYNLHEMVLERETVDLSYMLQQMADEFYPLLMDHANMIYLDVGEGLTVVADANKLARVFNNILKNAIAYSDGGSVIQLRAAQQGDTVHVAISNHGRTIPEQKLQTIFEKFYRLDDARSSNTGGAGLGLAIAREIVTLHGGRIEAVSENQVTTFTVELPVLGKS